MTYCSLWRSHHAVMMKICRIWPIHQKWGSTDLWTVDDSTTGPHRFDRPPALASPIVKSRSTAMAPEAQLPKTMKALVLRSTSQPPTVEIVPTPEPVVGSAVVCVLATSIISYTRDVYSGKRNYPFPTPLIVGTSAIARVVAVPVDSTQLRLGDFTHLDCMIRSRNDPSEAFLITLHEEYTSSS
nr:hypothetical protein CFP56_63532 [Quercus suber]